MLQIEQLFSNIALAIFDKNDQWFLNSVTLILIKLLVEWSLRYGITK